MEFAAGPITIAVEQVAQHAYVLSIRTVAGADREIIVSGEDGREIEIFEPDELTDGDEHS